MTINFSNSWIGDEMFDVPKVLYEKIYCNEDGYITLICRGRTGYVGLKNVYELMIEFWDK